MNVKMTVEKNLKGFTTIFIETPKGIKMYVNVVCKDKTHLAKLLYKLRKEYEDGINPTSKRK